MSVSTLSLLHVALCVRFVAVREAETRRAWQQQQANANAAAEAAALQAMHEESTRLAGEHEGGRVTSNFYLEGTAVLCEKIYTTIFRVCTSSVLGAVCCFGVSHNVTFYSVSPAMLYYLLKFIILQRCSRGKNNIPISQG